VRTTVSVWSRLPLRGSLQPRSVSRIRSEPIRPVHARFYPISTEHDGTEPDVNEPNGQLASRIPSSAASEPLNTTAQHATHLTTDQKVGDSSSPGRARSTNIQALRLGVVNDTSVGLSCSSYGLDGEGL
jgi:hypothetical protein